MSAADKKASPTPRPAAAREAAHDTRARILHTAFQLFHEQGFHATGIATILREANVNAGSLYHFFPSKEALLIGVLEYALVLLRPAVMEPAERRSHDPLERIFALLALYREGMQLAGCRMGCPIGNLALEVADDHADARRLIHQNFENWVAAVRAWLDEAGDRLPAECDRAQLARFVLTVMEGGLMQARAAGDLGPFDDSVAQLRAYIRSLVQLARRPHVRTRRVRRAQPQRAPSATRAAPRRAVPVRSKKSSKRNRRTP